MLFLIVDMGSAILGALMLRLNSIRPSLKMLSNSAVVASCRDREQKFGFYSPL
jgi:hypothetical protein